MLRILSFFLIVLAAGLGFAWLADNPGEMQIVWLGRELRTSFTVFVIALAALVVAAIVLFWLVAAFFRAPDRLGDYFAGRRRERGHRALSAGIIAAGAGDAALARRLAKRAQKFLPRQGEPLLQFLDAQTAMIEGDHAHARSVFETMEKDPETRLLALRGLFLEAERLNDSSAARQYAERAVRIAPHVPWAGGAVLELKAAQGDFDGALEILDAQRDSRLVDKAESHRLRAVLLTGKAMALADADPAAARRAAREAQKLAPDLTPAAVTAARALVRLGDPRKAGKVLEDAWNAAPHPEVAALYIHLKPGDGAVDRLKRAQYLKSLKPDHVESNIALAHAALDARDYALARGEALAAVAKGPRENVYLLLADVEDADGGNEGRVREWMSRAIQAPKEPAWVADGVVSPEWRPVSPVTGRLDAFRWTVPADRRASAVETIDNAAMAGAGASAAAPASVEGFGPLTVANHGASGADLPRSSDRAETFPPASQPAPARAGI